MSPARPLIIITPTWAGDIDHFRLMRRSLELSPLGVLPHHVVIQTEDFPLFEEFRSRPGLHLLTTADVLPDVVERNRVRARTLSRRFGRNMTRFAGSLSRTTRLPAWPSYTGWHTQQLCKLWLASEIDCDQAIILDSDVLVTHRASVDDFLSPEGVVCFAAWQRRSALGGKVLNWIRQAEVLFGARLDDPLNIYFDTPFVFDQSLLKRMLACLSARHGKAWWQVLLDCPPRRWSEFGVYKTFLAQLTDTPVIWREPWFSRYVYPDRQCKQLTETLESLLAEPAVHYVTLHSQSSGRDVGDPRDVLERLLEIVETAGV